MTTVHLINKGKLNIRIIEIVDGLINNECDLFEVIKAWHFVEKSRWTRITPALDFIVTGKCLEVFEEGLHTLTIKLD